MKKKTTKAVKTKVTKATKKVKLTDLVSPKLETNTQFFNRLEAMIEERNKLDTRTDEQKKADTQLIVTIVNAYEDPTTDEVHVRTRGIVQATSHTMNHFISGMIEDVIKEKVNHGTANAMDKLLLGLLGKE